MSIRGESVEETNQTIQSMDFKLTGFWRRLPTPDYVSSETLACLFVSHRELCQYMVEQLADGAMGFRYSRGMIHDT